jgi:hypothetical protein
MYRAGNTGQLGRVVKSGVLRVTAVHQDVPFTKAMTAAVDREIGDLARWLKLDLEMPGPAAGQRSPA